MDQSLKSEIKNNPNSEKAVQMLFTACQQGRTDIVRLLLDLRVDISHDFRFFNTACLHKRFDIMKLLIAHRANTENLSLILVYGDLDNVRLLIEAKVNLNAAQNLDVACQGASLEKVQLLVDHGVDVNIGGFQKTIKKAHSSQIVKLLLQEKIRAAQKLRQFPILLCPVTTTEPLCDANPQIFSILLNYVWPAVDFPKVATEQYLATLMDIFLGTRKDRKRYIQEHIQMYDGSWNGGSECESDWFILMDTINFIRSNSHLSALSQISLSSIYFPFVEEMIDDQRKERKLKEQSKYYVVDSKHLLELLSSAPKTIPKNLLGWVSAEGRTDIVKLILSEESKFSPYIDLKDKFWPLSYACVNGHFSVAKLLIESQANPFQFNNDCLKSAIQKNHPEIVKLLVELKAGGDQNKVLDWACKKGYEDIVLAAMEAKAEVNHKAVWSPLWLACEGKNFATVGILLAHKANVNNPLWEDPLTSACASGSNDLVELLLLYKAKIDGSYGFGEPMEKAIENGHLSTVDLLVRKGASIIKKLAIASQYGRIEIVRYLLEQKADVQWNSPIKVAAENGHLAVCQLLLEP